MTQSGAFTIVPLNTRPDLIEVCAAWTFSQWGCQTGVSSMARATARYESSATGNELPVTWVALSGDRPAGIVSLRLNDHPDITDLGPWVGSLFVHPFYRGQGLSNILLDTVERSAAEDYNARTLYLYTSDAIALYERRGWTKLQAIRDPTGHAPQGDTLMKKDL